MKSQMKHLSAYIFTVLLLASCSVSKYIPEGDYLLKDVYVTYDDSSKMLKEYDLKSYNQQLPNTKWFGAKIPLKIYTLSGTDTTRWTCKLFRKLGEDPILFDSVKARNSAEQMYQVLANAGYVKSEVEAVRHIKDKKLTLEYAVKAGKRYHTRNIHRDIADKSIDSLLQAIDADESLLITGMPLDINVLNQERNRIAMKLCDLGYYKFTKEDIRYTIDTHIGMNILVKNNTNNFSLIFCNYEFPINQRISVGSKSTIPTSLSSLLSATFHSLNKNIFSLDFCNRR